MTALTSCPLAGLRCSIHVIRRHGFRHWCGNWQAERKPTLGTGSRLPAGGGIEEVHRNESVDRLVCGSLPGTPLTVVCTRAASHLGADYLIEANELLRYAG